MRPSTTDRESSPARNAGTALDLEPVRELRFDAVEIERRTIAVADRPEPTGAPRVAALLRAIACMDLTSLSGDDTSGRIRRLCDAAREPLGDELLAALRPPGTLPRVAAVCVYPAFIETALDALRDTGIPVDTVAAGFPHGLSPLSIRIAEVRECAALGAAEIDIVIRRDHVLRGDWAAVYAEVRAFREAAGDALLKAILAAGELRSLDDVARAGLVALMAGADFLKTSTGKEAVNATLPAGAAMAAAIRAYAMQTGIRAGLKPAGGIRTPAQALDWLELAREELGEEWLTPERFRIGASGLLDAIARELESLAGIAGKQKEGRTIHSDRRDAD